MPALSLLVFLNCNFCYLLVLNVFLHETLLHPFFTCNRYKIFCHEFSAWSFYRLPFKENSPLPNAGWAEVRETFHRRRRPRCPCTTGSPYTGASPSVPLAQIYLPCPRTSPAALACRRTPCAFRQTTSRSLACSSVTSHYQN